MCMVFGETLMEYAIYMSIYLLPGHSLWWDHIKFTEFFSSFCIVTHPDSAKDGGFSRYILQGSGVDVCDSSAWARLTVSMCMTYLVPCCFFINRSISLQLTILRILMPRKVRISLKHTVDTTPA